MDDLINQKCVSCESSMDPMTKKEAEIMLTHVKGWNLDESVKKISKNFIFKDFKQALLFVNKVGELAEKEGHHPDIYLVNYKNVNIDLATHAIGGLSNNDFILASKIDLL